MKKGIKVWVWADATNGYICEFYVYTGKEGSKVEKNLGVKAVMTHLYHHVYFGNFFTSMSLPVDLLKLGVYGCGTMRGDRKGCPDGLQAVAKKGCTERGQSKTWQSGNFTVSVWQDSKPVVVAASNSDPLAKMSVTRKQKDGTRINVAAPLNVGSAV